MSKFIVLDGPPSSGVTSLSIKLAQEIFALTGKSVLYLSPDILIPSMGLIFPSAKKGRLRSLGKALDRADIQPDDILKEVNTVPNMDNIGYLGYVSGENVFSYPALTDDKVHALFRALIDLCDYVVVDCERSKADLISNLAHGYADFNIQVINPDMRSMNYYGADIPGDETIKVMNTIHNDMYLPDDEVASHFNGVHFKMPYSQELKKQEFTGALPQLLTDVKYRRVLTQLAKAVI